MTLLDEIKSVLEYLGGVRAEPPALTFGCMRGPVWWGVWWAVLIAIALAFSGQASKFIYIDF